MSVETKQQIREKLERSRRLLQQMPEYLNFFGLHTLARAVQEDASEVRALLEPG